MLVWQRVLDGLDTWSSLEDLLAHLVHSILYRRGVLLGKELHGDGTSIVPGLVEGCHGSLHFCDSGEVLPVPDAVDFGGENAIPNLWESGELVTNKAVELRASALQHKKAGNTTLDADSLASANLDIGNSDIGAIAGKGVWVRLSSNSHASPSVRDNLDMRSMNVTVLLYKVRSEGGSEILWRSHGILLRLDVDGVLDAVSGNDAAVVCMGVTADRCEFLMCYAVS